MDLLKKIEAKKALLIAVIFAIFAFSQFGINKLSGRIIHQKVSKGVPMLSYIYMGMAPSNTLSSGWYTADVIEIYNRSDKDTDKSLKETKRLMEERIKYFKENPKEANRYFWDKVKSTWLNPTFQTIWIITPGGARCADANYAKYISERPDIIEMVNYDTNTYKIEEKYFDVYQIIIFVFAGIALIKIRKNDNIEELLLPVIFIGGLLFHILWETKAIYVIWYYYILLPFSAYGIAMLYEYINKSKIFENIIKKINKLLS